MRDVRVERRVGRTVTLHEGKNIGWRPNVPWPRTIASEPRKTFNDAKVEAFGRIVVFGDRLRGDGHGAGWGALLGRRLTKEAFCLISIGKAKMRTKFKGAE